MSHLDEGTLHALLDGELDLAEVSEIQSHLGTCVACGSRLQEVKQVLAEADRLVGVMEVPAGTRRVIPEPPRPSMPKGLPEPDIWNEAPVLLLPEEEEARLRRARWINRVRWAAVIAVVVGAGKVITGAVRPNEPKLERDLTSASPSVPPVVVSEQERRRPESTVTVARAKAARPASQDRAAAPKLAARPETTVSPQVGTDTRAALDETVSEAVPDTTPAAAEMVVVRGTRDSADEAGARAMADSVPTQRDRRDEPAQPTQEDELATRRAAAAALAELDRERRRERANAATAALPPARTGEVDPESEPVARPPSLEQRAQIYLRIGLDEAVKHLGHPVHVIEGMTPQFIGLTRGQIPGTNSRRPVVRVVYLDARGRMILLDQQRMESGEAPAPTPGSLRWAIGDIMLYLRGEPSPEVLQSLRDRVR